MPLIDHIDDLAFCAELMSRLFSAVEKKQITYSQVMNDIIRIRRELNTIRAVIEERGWSNQ